MERLTSTYSLFPETVWPTADTLKWKRPSRQSAFEHISQPRPVLTSAQVKTHRNARLGWSRTWKCSILKCAPSSLRLGLPKLFKWDWAWAWGWGMGCYRVSSLSSLVEGERPMGLVLYGWWCFFLPAWVNGQKPYMDVCWTSYVFLANTNLKCCSTDSFNAWVNAWPLVSFQNWDVRVFWHH